MEQEFAKAVAKFEAGNHAAAEKILLTILKRQKDIPDVLHLLAFIALESDRPEAASGYLAKVVEIVPGDAGMFNLLGCARLREKKLDDAIDAFSRALAIAPGLADAHHNLALALWDKGDRDAALAAFGGAVEHDPNDAEGHFRFAAALAKCERLEDSEKHLSRAIGIDPAMTKALILLGDVLGKMEEPARSADVLGKALALDPDNGEIHRLLGDAYRELGQVDDALASYAKALAIQPDNTGASFSLACLLEMSNKLDQASEAVREGLNAAPDDFGLNLIAAKLEYRGGDHEAALALLDAMTVDEDTPLDLRRDRCFELGRVHDRLRDPDAAFECFTEGNALARRSWGPEATDKDVMLGYIEEHLEVVTEKWVSTWTPAFGGGGEGERAPPVFLIGFPRSGTTLLDQILDSHPGIRVLEEKPMVETVRSSLDLEGSGYPAPLAGLSDDGIAALRRLYFDTADRFAAPGDGGVVIDKLPLNTVEAALIHRMFPDAKFILVLRHPCDVCLSCFMQSFGINAGMANFLTLEDSVHLYERVMTLWRRYETCLDLAVFKTRYEDLVDDFEGSVRELLNFLGLEWDDAVLDYRRHAAGRDINTPSYTQVTQEIYTRSRYRWLRYEKYFEPLIGRLRPFMEEFGYAGKS